MRPRVVSFQGIHKSDFRSQCDILALAGFCILWQPVHNCSPNLEAQHWGQVEGPTQPLSQKIEWLLPQSSPALRPPYKSVVNLCVGRWGWGGGGGEDAACAYIPRNNTLKRAHIVKWMRSSPMWMRSSLVVRASLFNPISYYYFSCMSILTYC